MFERFTDRARRVLVLAQEEARLLNHSFIGTEHILLGLIHEGEGVAAKALESLGISLEAVREKVKGRPDKSAAAEAGSFLVVAQERLNNVRTARRNAEEKKANASLGKTAYKTYCDVSEAALTKLMITIGRAQGSEGGRVRAVVDPPRV